jgi:hypothetical protein
MRSQTQQAVRWNVRVSKETDSSLRNFLVSQGLKKSELSRFVEQAVRTEVFHRTVQDIKARNASTPADQLQNLIDVTVTQVRTERRTKQETGRV